MAPLAFTTTHNLGTWITHDMQTCRPKDNDFSLVEKVELAFFKVNPYSGAIDANTRVTCRGDDGSQVYESLLRTRPDYLTDGILKLLFVPMRTHTVRDLIGELLIPINRRDLFESEKNFITTTARIGFFILEVFTLIARLFTCIPMAIYNHFYKPPHPARTYFPEEDALFVECKKEWSLRVQDQPEAIETLTGTFSWRVDFYAPLQSIFEWNNTRSFLGCPMLSENFIREAANFQYLKYENQIPSQEDNHRFLYERLEELVVEPTVTFC